MSRGQRVIGRPFNHFADVVIHDEILFDNFEITENDQGTPTSVDNTFDINTNGTNIFSLDQSGNLTITGGFTGSGFLGRLRDIDNTTWVDVDDTPEQIDFATSSTIRMIIDSGGDILINEDLTITGNLTVNGTETIFNIETLEVEDHIIHLASNNPADVIDIGYYGEYNDGTERYAGIFRDATDGAFRVFDNLTVLPSLTIDNADGSYNELFTILASGNIGINKIAPTSALDIVGNTFMLGTLEIRTDNDPSILIRDVSDTSGGILNFGNTNHGVGRGEGLTNFTQDNDVVLHTAGNVGGGSAGDIGLITEGGYLKIESESGRVGINIDPTYPLDVVGNINTTTEYLIGGAQKLTSTTLGALVVNSSLENVGTLTSLTISGDLLVDTNTLFVDSTNNRVGIGELSPDTLLHITTSGESRIKVEATGITSNAAIQLLNTTGGTELGLAGANGNFGTGILDGDTALRSIADNIFVYTGSNANLGMKIATTTNNVAFDVDTLFIDAANDRVGINDSSPLFSLDVNGDVLIQGGDLFLLDADNGVSASPVSIALRLNTNIVLDINDSTGIAAINSNTTINGNLIVNDSSSLAFIQLTNSSSGTGASNGALIELDTIDINFENMETGGFNFINSSSSNVLRILDNGNVGIGTNNPQTLLHINDTTTTTTVIDMVNILSSNLGFGGIAKLNLGKLLTTGNAFEMFYTNVGDNNADNRVGFGFTNNLVMTLTNNNRLGLGVFNPSVELEIRAASQPKILLREDGGAAGGEIQFGNSGHGVGRGRGKTNFTAGNDVLMDTTGTGGSAGAVGMQSAGGFVKMDSTGIFTIDASGENLRITAAGEVRPANSSIHSSGGGATNVIAGDLPYARYTRTSGQSHSSSGGFITFDWETEVNDRGGFSESAGVITFASVGIYSIHATIKFANNTTGYREIDLVIGVLGSLHNTTTTAATGSAQAKLSISGIVNITNTGTNTLLIDCFQNSGGNLNMFGELNICRIGNSV